jgi:hypothetical protein
VPTSFLRPRCAAAFSALTLLFVACATGGRTFPLSSEPVPHALIRAATAIAEATTSGADSLAPDPLRIARQRLTAAANEVQAKRPDRAGLFAREAIADAMYAKAVADRVTAERARAAAAAQLDQLSASSSGVPGPRP